MRFGWKPKEASARIRWLARITAVIVVVVYLVIYWFQPFSVFANTLLANSFTALASIFSAVVATMIWGLYEKGEGPRKVWGNFAIGVWLWVAGEISWGYINLTRGEVPVGMQDVFWMISYLFFGQALLAQYKILNQPTALEVRSRVLIVVLSILGLIWLTYHFLITSSQTTDMLSALANAFYPAVDVLLAGIALWLARSFAGGAFARPWLGMLAFSFSDLTYAWLDLSGMYAWSVDQGNLLSVITDVAYFAAYLILGLGVLSQWLFLKYGLRTSTQPRQDAVPRKTSS